MLSSKYAFMYAINGQTDLPNQENAHDYADYCILTYIVCLSYNVESDPLHVSFHGFDSVFYCSRYLNLLSVFSLLQLFTTILDNVSSNKVNNVNINIPTSRKS